MSIIIIIIYKKKWQTMCIAIIRILYNVLVNESRPSALSGLVRHLSAISQRWWISRWQLNVPLDD